MNKVSRCGPGSSHGPSLLWVSQLEVFADELLQTNLPGRPVGDMQSSSAAPEEFQLCAGRGCATMISAVAKTVLANWSANSKHGICAICWLLAWPQNPRHRRGLIRSVPNAQIFQLLRVTSHTLCWFGQTSCNRLVETILHAS